MKRKAVTIVVIFLTAVVLSGCATVFGGKITECQKAKPAKGQASRQVRVVPLIFDIIVWPGIIIDFATRAIYKPCDRKVNNKPSENNNNNHNKPPGMN